MQLRITLFEDMFDKFLYTRYHDHQIINFENQRKEKDHMIISIMNKVDILEEKIN